MKEDILLQIKGGLIVSCQALKEEPLYSSYIMSRMAYAAQLGGAVGIRANYIADILEIKKTITMPMIGIVKETYPGCEVYITPTIKEVDALVEAGVEIIATDATKRIRPNGTTLEIFFKKIKEKYPNQIFMADCSNYEEGMNAAKVGFDIISTTMNGYTKYTQTSCLPNYQLIHDLVSNCGKPVIAEGGIWTPEQLKKVFEAGVHAAVVGTAITRPMEITKRFVDAIL